MILICGCNNFSQIGEKSNNHSPAGFPAISPPIQLNLDISTISSYSVYCEHSVITTHNTKTAKAVGYNDDYRISCSLPKTILNQYTEITLKDSKCLSYTPISSVCGEFYTLYLVKSPETGDKTKLLFSFDGSTSQFPLFLNIGDSNPISLFGGRLNSAAIDSLGGILYVSELLYDSPNLPIKTVFLPENEKAVSLAVCDDFIITLGQSGRVFESPSSQTDKLTFSEVGELKGIEVTQIAGTFNHCFAVTKEGVVYGIGSNKCGKLGVGRKIEEVKKFVEIETLKSYKIKEAFAGRVHSLFLTDEGKVLACGTNDFGHLNIVDGITEYSVFEPVETKIKEGASFCIAGDSISAIFVNCEPPKNCPNRKVTDF